MLINLSTICKKYHIDNVGVLHIGAHEGEERDAYKNCGFNKVVWIEANPELAKSLEEKINKSLITFDSEYVLNHAVYNVEGEKVKFKITNNLQSSSILDFGRHEKKYPEISVTKTIDVTTTRIDILFQNNPGLAGDLKFANLDIQGVELQAIQGFGEYLNQFRWIYTEVNMCEIYKGNSLVWDIDRYLLEFNFIRSEIKMSRGGWGDAFYVKKDKIGKLEKTFRFYNIYFSKLFWNIYDPLRNFERKIKLKLRRGK